MPRRIGLAAAGRFLIDNPPPESTGRGSAANRASTLAGFSVAKLVEYLFEGVAPGAWDDNIGIADLTENGSVSTAGSPLSYASLASVDFSQTAGEYARLTANYWGATAHTFEMWYRLDELPDRHAVSSLGNSLRLVANSNNDSSMIGAVINTISLVQPFPAAKNVFNGVEEWESFVDTYIQGLTFQLVEAHEVGTRANYLVVLNGVPIAVGTNSGHLPFWDATGPAFNGQASTGVAEKIGAEFGYFAVYDDAQTLSLQEIRELFETSSFDNANMLDLPVWVPLDAENVTLPDPFTLKYADLADVLDSTGIRSCAIPRSVFQLKVYFEIEIIDEGDSTTAVRPGIRRMITAADVGDQTTVGEDGNEHHFYVDGTDLRVDRHTLVHAGATDQSTGRVYGFAIDWETGDFWVSEDGVWLQGDPTTATNPSGTLDKDTAWAAHVWNNGADGNAKVRLRTKFYEMISVPSGWNSWEPKNYTIEPEVNGPNRRQAELDRMYQEVEHEWLFEGDASGYLVDSARVINERARDLISGLDPVDLEIGPKLSHVSAGSVRWERIESAQGEVQQDIWNNAHAFEYWFRQPNYAGAPAVICLFCAQNNNNLNVGRQGTDLFPSARNNFNTGLIWLNDEVDVYGDDKPHQLMEIHPGNPDLNFIVTLDGMPIADGAGGGVMQGFFTSGPEFNGDSNDAPINRGGAHHGSFQTYRGGQIFTLFDVRRLYEASVITPVELVNAGMQSGDVLDAQISGSTEFGGNYLFVNARLNFPGGSWAPASALAGEYLQVDFGEVKTIKGVRSQGSPILAEWMITADIDYSDDDATYVTLDGGPYTFNTDQNTVVENVFPAFKARYVRIVAVTWQSWPDLRLEFILEQDGDPVAHAAGVETGLINNDEMTASSETPGRESYDGRLNGLGHSPGAALTTEWLKIDLGRVVEVTEHKIQGAFVQWYQTYFLEYNNDDSATWYPYNNSEVLNANVDATAVVTNVLTFPFRARYIRIRPLTWSGWPTIRTEFTIKNEIKTDMLSSPQWCSRDAINCTVGGTGNKDLTCGDVTDDTGGRSYAIPRRGRVYFEVEIVAQGDDTASNLLGLRKLAEPSNVGFDPDTAIDEYHTDGAGDVEDGQDNSLGITGTLGTAATGRIFQFAIDWNTGDWWMGTDDTLWAGVGGSGDPDTLANPLDALDIDHNWSVSNRVNGAQGNGQVRLITAFGDLNFTPPAKFVAWEDAG